MITQRYSGLREQDLIEAKDLLLVETSDMLQVPLFTAEALLRNHGWYQNSYNETSKQNPAFQSGVVRVSGRRGKRMRLARVRELEWHLHRPLSTL